MCRAEEHEARRWPELNALDAQPENEVFRRSCVHVKGAAPDQDLYAVLLGALSFVND